MRCDSCGLALRTGEERCSHCGTPVPVSVHPSAGPTRWREEETVLDPSGGSTGDGSGAAEPLRPGQRLGDLGDAGAGRYEVLRELARGGMGVVYLARDRRFAERLGGVNRRVVVKRVLDPGEHGVERFLRETRAVSSLEHENIVSIHDFGQDAEGPYIVMGYVEGGTLKTLVSGEGPLDDDAFYEVARGLGRALDYVHEHSILHRDVKPSNVLMTRAGLPKLSDFGLVRIGDDSDLSTTGHGMGTAAYAAPEQRRGEKDADQRADLYGLGATLYYALTGESPRTIRESRLPDRWRELVLRCVEEDPEARFTSAKEFLAALEAANDDTSTGTGELREGVRCANCKAFNRAGESYCRQCGVGLFRHCPSCGVTGEAAVRFCVHCGLDIDSWQRSEDALLEAERLLERARYEEAIAAASRADAAFPGRREVQETLALASRRRTALLNAWDRAEADDRAERYEEARRSWLRVLHHDPDNKRARTALAASDSLIRRRDLRRALERVRAACERPRWPAAAEAMEVVLALAGPDDAARVVEAEELFDGLEQRVRATTEAFDRAFRRGDRPAAAAHLAELEAMEVDADLRGTLRGRLAYLDAHRELERRLAEHDWHAARRAWNELARVADEERAAEVASLRSAVGELRDALLERCYREFDEAVEEREFERAEALLVRSQELEGNPAQLEGLNRLLAHRRRVRLVRRLQVAGLRALLVLALASALGLWGLGLHEERLQRAGWLALDEARVEDARVLARRSWVDPAWPLARSVLGAPLEELQRRLALLDTLLERWPAWTEVDPRPLGRTTDGEALVEAFVAARLRSGWRALAEGEPVDARAAVADLHALGDLQPAAPGAAAPLEAELAALADLPLDGVEEASRTEFLRAVVALRLADRAPAGIGSGSEDPAALVESWMRAALEAGDEERLLRLEELLAALPGGTARGAELVDERRLAVSRHELAELRRLLVEGRWSELERRGAASRLEDPAVADLRGRLQALVAPLSGRSAEGLADGELEDLLAELVDARPSLVLSLGERREDLAPALDPLLQSLSDEVRARLDRRIDGLARELAGRAAGGAEPTLELGPGYPLAGIAIDGREQSLEASSRGGNLLRPGPLAHGRASFELELVASPARAGVRVVRELELAVDARPPGLVAEPVLPAEVLAGVPVEVVLVFDEPLAGGRLDAASAWRAGPGGERLSVPVQGRPLAEGRQLLRLVPPRVPGRARIDVHLVHQARDPLGNRSGERELGPLPVRSDSLAAATARLGAGSEGDWLATLELLAPDLAVARPDYEFLLLASRALRQGLNGTLVEGAGPLGERELRGTRGDGEALAGIDRLRRRARRTLAVLEGVQCELARSTELVALAPAERVLSCVEASLEGRSRLELGEVGELARDLADLAARAERALLDADALAELLADPRLADLESHEAPRVQRVLDALEVVAPPDAFVAWFEASLALFERFERAARPWPLRVLEERGGEAWQLSEGLPDTRQPRHVAYGPAPGMDMVHVPSLDSGGFYIGRTEVSELTFGAFQGVLPEGQGLLRPVVGRSYLEADVWCSAAGLRLPTVEEWLRAGRAPSWSRSSWQQGAALERDLAGSHPVGQGPAGEPERLDRTWCGAIDMGANVREWCSDSLEGRRRAIRGWSWKWREGELPWTSASSLPESSAADDVGWRPVLDVPPRPE